MRFLRLLLLSVGIGSIVSSSVAFADPVSPVGLFQRCYNHLVGEPPTFEMTTRFLTKATGASSTDDGRRDYAINLCSELLNGLSIQSDGLFSTPASSSFFTSTELSTIYPHLYLNFQRLHLSWFSKTRFTAVDDTLLANYTVEPSTPALYWNAALFIPNQKASSVVTSTEYYKPLRSNPPLPSPSPGQTPGPCVFPAASDYATQNLNYTKCQLNTRLGIASTATTAGNYLIQFEPGGVFTLDSNGNLIYTGTSSYDSKRASLINRYGQTVGLETVSSSLPFTSYTSFTNPNASVSGGVTITASNMLLTAVGGKAVTGYTAKTAGGGILGSPDYVLMNMTDYPDAGNGGLKVARDWSYDVMGDFLCKALPALTFADGNANVQKTVTASTPPFRVSASCMACHANLDLLAYSVRNLQVGQTTTVGDSRVGKTLTSNNTLYSMTPFLAKWPTTAAAVSGFTDGTANFQNTPPTGRLYYRSYDDSLVDLTINNGVSDTGAAIAQTNDFYACAVSRYFQYFTGRPVDLNAPSVSQASFNSEQTQERNWIIAQGQSLKNDPKQSLKTVILNMMKSSWYRDQSYGGVK